ncbi:MAG: CsgG/HfaB family protein [Pseudomonadales bacterium]
MTIRKQLVIFLIGFSFALPSFADKSQQATYVGPKQVVAVLPFANRVQNVYGSWSLGEGFAEILITELVKSGRFLIVEREVISDIVKEQELGMTGLVSQNTAAKTGQLSGAQFMIRGAITEFNDLAGGGGLTIAYSKAEAGTKSKTAYVGIDVRIVDNATGQIYASYNAHAKAKSRGVSLAAKFTESAESFKVGASGFYDTSLGQATRDAIEQVIEFIVDESSNIPWQGSLIRADQAKAYINRGANTNLKIGDRLIVYAPGEPLIDPETGFNLGSDEERKCDVVVRDVRSKFSIADTSSCSGHSLDRGFIVRFE